MKRAVAVFLLMLIALLPFQGFAEDEAVYTLKDSDGKTIVTIAHVPSEGDEYISGDNQHYEVTSVNEGEKTALVTHIGAFEMPDVSWLDQDATLPASATNKLLAMYCTHSDESYEPTDGISSDEDMGGIYDVADAFAAALTELGTTVELNKATHHPHDAGAYRRSRQTAVQLLKLAPDAIFDLHRDGIPDPDEYAVTIGGEKMSKVRLLVGKGNQNGAANKSFATQIKAVGDKLYPGLIKDIYMGKGAYNQDLYPRSVLLEFGTHTLSKERVLASTTPMARVIYRTIYGGVTGAAGASDVGNNASSNNANAETTPVEQDNQGAGSGVLWVVGIFVAGLIIFALVSTGSKQGTMEKLKRSASEMTGGLFGKKPDKQ